MEKRAFIDLEKPVSHWKATTTVLKMASFPMLAVLVGPIFQTVNMSYLGHQDDKNMQAGYGLG